MIQTANLGIANDFAVVDGPQEANNFSKITY